MKVQIWRSFSCNNSSSYYMVARFSSPETAEASAAELAAFFEAHARDSDDMWERGEDPISNPTAAATAFAAKHGFPWTGYLSWGDEGMVDDEPHVWAVGSSVLIYHGYCGGFGDNLPKYFDVLGAGHNEQDWGSPIMAIQFEVPDTPKAREAAAAIGAYIAALAEDAESEEGWVFGSGSYTAAPWGTGPTEDMEFECGVPFPGWNDGHTVGLALEIPQVGAWETIPGYLEAHDITDYRLTLDEPGVVARYRAIAAATCRECGASPLRFIDASVHDAPDDQLACDACGGMFEVSGFVTADDDA